eukprot:scaffold12559_cov132-Skeletonema_marinoi.AAC.1
MQGEGVGSRSDPDTLTDAPILCKTRTLLDSNIDRGDLMNELALNLEDATVVETNEVGMSKEAL